MSTRRLGVAVAVLGGFLYAVGGSDGTSPLNTGRFISDSRCKFWRGFVCAGDGLERTADQSSLYHFILADLVQEINFHFFLV